MTEKKGGEKKLNWEEVEEFYLKAALATYASGEEPQSFSDLPRSKVFRFKKENLCYIDTFFMREDGDFGRCSGFTIIYMDNKSIWTMSYSGWWKLDCEKLLPFLQKALSMAYESGEFIGGRGPMIFAESSGDLVYNNHVFNGGSKELRDLQGYRRGFCEFNGEDSICLKGEAFGDNLYEHDYHGFALVP